MPKGSTWTEDEKNILRKHYPKGGVKKARRWLPGRADGAIKAQADYLGIKIIGFGAWTESEKELFKEHYPQGGFLAATQYLPGRTKASMHNMAINLGVSAPLPVACRGAETHYYPQDDAIDEAICTAYRDGKNVKALGVKLDRPEGWVKHRALNLGVRIARTRNDVWTEEELNILWERGGRSLATIQKSLSRQGYKRSQHAIKTALHKRDIDTTPDNYTASEFSRLMGVSDHMVIGWINKGWLKARKYHRLSVASTAPGKFWITPLNAREFLVESVAHINLGKCDKYWLVDLLDGKYNNRAVKDANDDQRVA